MPGLTPRLLFISVDRCRNTTNYIELISLEILRGENMSSIFKRFHQKKLGELVKWVCYPDRFLDRNEPLLYIIFNAQAEIKGMDFYLTEDESEIANEILSVYKNCLAEDYIKGILRADKQISRMSGKEYFMFSLVCFLQENECKPYFRSDKLNIERRMYEYVKSIPSGGDSATIYSLNDFSKVSPIRNKYFANSKPVSTLVEVNSLVKKGCKIEIEVIAIKEK